MRQSLSGAGKSKLRNTGSREKKYTIKRSIYVVEDIKKGETFTEKNIRIIRPGGGLAPKFFENVLGKPSKTELKRGTALTWNLI